MSSPSNFVMNNAADSSSPEILTATDTKHPYTISHFDDLPVELIIRILRCAINTNGYLRKHSFSPYTALLVSKQWNEIALGAPELWTLLSLNLTNKHEFTLALKLLKQRAKRSGNRPLHLDVTVAMQLSAFTYWHELLACAAGGAQWASLCLRSPYVPLFLHSIYNWVTVTHGSTGGPKFLEKLVLLEVGDTEENQTAWLLASFRYLTHLRALHTQSLSLSRWDEMPTSWAFVCGSLEELILEKVDPDALELFQQVQFPNLQTLGIYSWYRSPQSRIEKRFNTTAPSLPALKNLALYELDPLNAKTILSGSPGIQNLAVSSSTLLSLDGSEAFPKLISLTLYGTLETMKAGVRELIEKRIPTLERLSVDQGCWKGIAEAEVPPAGTNTAQYKVELLEEEELEFGPVCRRFPSIEWRASK